MKTKGKMKAKQPANISLHLFPFAHICHVHQHDTTYSLADHCLVSLTLCARLLSAARHVSNHSHTKTTAQDLPASLPFPRCSGKIHSFPASSYSSGKISSSL